MAGLLLFVPLRVVFSDQFQQVFFSLDMGQADKFINVAVADLAAVFHVQSGLQQQLIWPHFERDLVAKHSLLPSFFWMILIRSPLVYFQVSVTPNPFAFFSIAKSLILTFPPVVF